MPIIDLRRKLAAYLRAAAATRSFNAAGLPLLPKSGDSVYSRESYNTFLIWIKQLGLPAAARILDIGANHGDFARAASSCYPRARVWLFEPLPTLWPQLERLARRSGGRWSVQQFALGAKQAVLPLQADDRDDAIASFLGFSDNYRRGNPAAAGTKSIPTRVMPLDDFCAQEEIPSIDLMKVDVEGFEFDVLAGAGRMLRNSSAVIIEVSLIRRAAGSADALERMLKVLTGAGFHLVNIIPSLFSRDEPWKPVEYNLLARRSL